MSTETIETQRLVIRAFVPDDLPAVHRVLDLALGNGSRADDLGALAERRSWLQWSILSQEWFPRLHQPPYGERAVTLKANGELVGVVGFVPLLDAYEQIPELRCADAVSGCNTPEFGLFWAVHPAHQRQGYATEAGRAMIAYAFIHLRLKRVLATTEYDNAASQAVMRKLGMRLARNPYPNPVWLQVVGILENTGASGVNI